MADINVERKRPSILPWILGLVLLAALIWFGAQYIEGRGDASPDAVQTDGR